MAKEQNPDEGMVMARIIIERTLQPDGTDLVHFIASDGDGLVIPMIEILGMLELAKDGLLHPTPEEVRDDGEGDDEAADPAA